MRSVCEDACARSSRARPIVPEALGVGALVGERRAQRVVQHCLVARTVDDRLTPIVPPWLIAITKRARSAAVVYRPAAELSATWTTKPMPTAPTTRRFRRTGAVCAGRQLHYIVAGFRAPGGMFRSAEVEPGEPANPTGCTEGCLRVDDGGLSGAVPVALQPRGTFALLALGLFISMRADPARRDADGAAAAAVDLVTLSVHCVRKLIV
jgi:hypothetical protein